MSQETGADFLNPYAAPESFKPIVTSAGASSAPNYKLYSVGAVVLVTFVGSLLAGGILMAIDYWRLGKLGAAKICLAVSMLCQLLLFGLIVLLPEKLPTGMFVAPQLLAMYFVAQYSLETDLRAHYMARGKAASLWKAAGVGLACFTFYLIVGFLIFLSLIFGGLIPLDE